MELSVIPIKSMIVSIYSLFEGGHMFCVFIVKGEQSGE